MPIFEVMDDTPPLVDRVAKAVLQFGNRTADELVALHREGRNALFNQPGFTVADLQAVIDKMGPQAVLVFMKSAALAQFIESQYPGILRPEEFASLVPYDEHILQTEGRIVFDPQAKYPTEV